MLVSSVLVSLLYIIIYYILYIIVSLLLVATVSRLSCYHYGVKFHSIVLSKILYALSTWAATGYISLDNVRRLNKVLRKAKRYRFTDSLLTFSELLEQSDEQLFSHVVCTNHCLFHLLGKDNSQLQMFLRHRGYSFNLPIYQYNLTRKSFVIRNLYLRK